MARSPRTVPGWFNLLASTADVGRGRNLAGSLAKAIVHARPAPIAGLGRSLSRRHIHHGEKGGSAVGKTCRGKGTKCMVVVDGQGVPVGVQLASAQIAECRLAESTLQQVKVPRVGRGRPRSHLRRVVADRGYDSDALRARFKQRGTELIVPYRKNVRNRRFEDKRKLRRYRKRWKIGVSSQGHINQPVQVRPRLTDSSLVAWEASWSESETMKPSDNMLRKEYAQLTRLQRAVNADVASLHANPEAETVDNVRKQQEPIETSPMRRLSPAGYQRRHGEKENVATGEALGVRRRNLVEEATAITASGKCRRRHQGGGSGRTTVDGRAAKRVRGACQRV
jgi:hypothetical protein